MQRITAKQRVDLGRWMMENHLRLYGLGIGLDEAAKQASKAMRVPVSKSAVRKMSTFLHAVGAMLFTIRRRRKLHFRTIDLTTDEWHALNIAIVEMKSSIDVFAWTPRAIHRSIMERTKRLKVSAIAVAQALDAAGFEASVRNIDQVVTRKKS